MSQKQNKPQEEPKQLGLRDTVLTLFGQRKKSPPIRMAPE
ncbi:hypothetical protein ASESINO_2 [Erwinia phage vB_EamM_Asesino]|uniref:Uncharacterized protein n=1 Tax=Erwinia phage vB_EamM_Asesino TaxID=1883370 RepID=A0A1B2I9T9_9CAUD|nr:hypothetical protein ASESINO_2 [Erwinia phage vB_EamM_Asesino]ANZ48027.1 hypothetical protein ASESINO_2 [Erwinia phage vB_EamM_Asesino]